MNQINYCNLLYVHLNGTIDTMKPKGITVPLLQKHSETTTNKNRSKTKSPPIPSSSQWIMKANNPGGDPKKNSDDPRLSMYATYTYMDGWLLWFSCRQIHHTLSLCGCFFSHDFYDLAFLTRWASTSWWIFKKLRPFFEPQQVAKPFEFLELIQVILNPISYEPSK